MATTWPRVEIFVVDDHSSDGTGGIARRVAGGDPRVTIMDAPPLPDGWFGKQWACHSAMQRARGSVLLFTDADTAHGPELLGRAMRALADRPADLISVMGRQELGTFWERLLMPQVFVVIISRYGGLEQMSRSTDPYEKIANGQFFLVRRNAYDRAGGHETVRDHVAEDLRIAQEVCRAGGAVHFLDGRGYLATRMYDGLGELIRGWEKNVYAGGRDTMRLGRTGQALLRVLYPACPHITDQLWNELGYAACCGDLLDVAWAEVDESALQRDEIELMLQVNGKLRGAILVPAQASKEAIEAIALASEAFTKQAQGAAPKKVIVVPGRLVNVVI